MADKNDKEREEVSLEQVVLSQAYALQALIKVLEKKGVLTKKEVLEELEMIQEVIVTAAV